MSAFFVFKMFFMKLETKAQAGKHFALHKKIAINFYGAATITENGGIIVV